MSNWTTVTATDLNAASVSGKLTIIRTIASNKSLPDPAPAAIDKVTKELLGAIGFSGKYALDQDTTKIPNSLLDLAIQKIVRACSRAVGSPWSEDERADERTYESRLDKIRRGDWPIETPDNPVAVKPVQSPIVVPKVGSRERQFKRGSSY